MPPKERTPTTQFVLDIWAEPAEPDRLSWRGKVHRLGSGDARYFRG